MTKYTRTELVPLEVRHEEQSLETVEVSQQDQSAASTERFYESRLGIL